MITPIPKSIEMAGDRDLYSVSFDWDLTRDVAQDISLTNFNDWLAFSDHARISGWGRHSGRKLWQVPRALQRRVYRVCKGNQDKREVHNEQCYV